jgi:hypothetical protein
MKFFFLFSLFPLIQSTLTWRNLNVDGGAFGPHLFTDIPQESQEKKRLLWRNLDVVPDRFGPQLITGIPKQLQEKKRLKTKVLQKKDSEMGSMERSLTFKMKSNPSVSTPPFFDSSKTKATRKTVFKHKKIKSDKEWVTLPMKHR